MSKFNKKITNKTTNLAGGKALKRTPKMELIVSVLSTFLKDKYYESGDERQERIRELCEEVDDMFIAKLAIVARKKFYLRSVSHLLVGELAKKHKGDALVSKTLQKVALRPDDLIEVVAYLGKPLPNQIKKGIRKSLLKFDRYQLAKYQHKGKKVSLVDLFNLTHPNPELANKEQKKAWKDLINDELKQEKTWENRLSAGENKKKVWSDLVENEKIGYMALLRNLRNIAEQGYKKTIKKACQTIADKEKVKRSKQLPFRFYTAYQYVENQDMLEAVEQALKHSLENVPKFDGKTLIAVDGSGSMTGDPIEKASIFAAALLKSNDAELTIYDTSIKKVNYLKGEPLLTLSEKIQREANAGGTQTSLVFQYAHKTGTKYDRIIILSDQESWAEGYYYGDDVGVNNVYNEYKKENDCFVYAIDIQGYGTRDVGGAKVFHLTGWSEKMFDFMKWIEKENQLIKFIEKTEI